jgi:hypothetical protein
MFNHEDNNYDFDPDPYFDHDPYNNDYLFKNTHWVMTEFDMWDPNDGIEYPVIELSLVGNVIRDKEKLKKALTNLHNLKDVYLIGLLDSHFNRISDKELLSLIDLDKLPKLRRLLINNNIYTSDGLNGAKSFDRLRADTRKPKETASILNSIRTKQSGTALPYDLIPNTMSFIHTGKHVPQSISQKRANISGSSSSLGGRTRKSKSFRKYRKSRKSKRTKKRRYKH